MYTTKIRRMTDSKLCCRIINLTTYCIYSHRSLTILFRLSTIMEMDSTGSILSDLNCLSKSEDDLDTNGVLLQNKKYREWKEYGAENLVYTHHSTLDKVAKFNSLDRATIATVKAYDSAHTASAQTQVTPSENIVSNASETTVYANHSFVSKMVIKPETCTSCGKR